MKNFISILSKIQYNILFQFFIVIIVTVLSALYFYSIGHKNGYAAGFNNKKAEPIEKSINVTTVSSDTLTNWETYMMATAITESNCDSTALGASQDAGIFQITPIYVKEVNNILDSIQYKHKDAFNINKSIAMFYIFQSKHNPNFNINKAMRLHNPGGAAINYYNKIKENMKYVKRYETIRRSLIAYNF